MSGSNKYKCPKCGSLFRSDKLSSCPKCNTQIPDEELDHVSRVGYSNNSVPKSVFAPKSKDYRYVNSERSFLSVLFDWTFKDFIYVRVARAFYLGSVVTLSIGLIVFELLALFTLFNGLTSADTIYYGGGTGYFMATVGWSLVLLIFLLPAIYLSLIILLRLSLEAGVALIKIAENTRND
jgi:hypothetical protein